MFDFADVFDILLNYAAGVKKDILYGEIFNSYYRIYNKPSITEEYKANKVKSREKVLEREGRRFYAEEVNYHYLHDDLKEYVLPYISDKFGLCSELCQLIYSDDMDNGDREYLLSYYPNNADEILDFITHLIIFSLNRCKKAGTMSPIMTDRIILPVISPCEHFSGRKKELQALSELLETQSKVFIFGIGGIGKSEFVKKYLKAYGKNYTNVLFLTYGEDLKATIAEISFKDDKSNDSIDIRFHNHSEYLKRMKEDTLIIIDNFDILPNDDEYLETLLSYNCKIIFTTRNHFGDAYTVFELSEMDTDELMLIAKSMKISESADSLFRLFALVHNHTLVCDLILRLLKHSAYSADELLPLLGESNTNPDITDNIKASGRKRGKYHEHIKKLFDLFSLSEEQKNMLRIISLIPAYGLGDRYFKKLAGLNNFNSVNELDEIGLIYYHDGTINIHRLVADVAAAELIPDMENCRTFLSGVISEALFFINTAENRVRSLALLPIADNVIAYAEKNDIDFYIYFLNTLCTYAEVFYDTYRMKKYIDEVDKYINDDTPPNFHAVHFMSKAALAKYADDSTMDAINFTLKAAEYIDENEIYPALNIYNNLFQFYMEEDIMDVAAKYCAKTMELVNLLPADDHNKLVFLFNVNEFQRKTEDYKNARKSIKCILDILVHTAPDSLEYRDALHFASEIARKNGDENSAIVYESLALKLTGELMLEVGQISEKTYEEALSHLPKFIE